jgi:uncharacterized integral membrane protein
VKLLKNWALNVVVFVAISIGGGLIGALAIVARLMDRIDRRAARGR